MIKKTIIGCNVKKKQKNIDLEELLNQWIKLNQAYIEEDASYLPYGSNERTCVGFLAAAAWKIGFVALEEFRMIKEIEPITYTGRADLYIKKEKNELHIEAKFKWLSLTNEINAEKITKIANETLSAAVADVEKVDRKNGFGVAFLPVYLSNKKVGFIEDRVRTCIEIFSKIDCDAIAWFFPEYFDGVKRPKNTLPGVFVIVNKFKG